MEVNKKAYLVFLDIDGVFTSQRVHTAHNSESAVLWQKFDPVAVDFMNYIHDTYNVEFVIMSTWKDHLPNNTTIRHWVRAAFSNSGFRGKIAHDWKTDPENEAFMKNDDRAIEVKNYLAERDWVADFILFDDNAYRFDDILGIKRLVRTDEVNGMLHKHMLHAKSIMGQWERKNGRN